MIVLFYLLFLLASIVLVAGGIVYAYQYHRADREQFLKDFLATRNPDFTEDNYGRNEMLPAQPDLHRED